MIVSAVIIIHYNQVQRPVPTPYQSKYLINASMLPNVSSSNYSAPQVKFPYNGEQPHIFAPRGITGLTAGYTSYVGNAIPVLADNMPISAFSMVSVFNSTEAAINQYNYNCNISMQQHTIAGANLTLFEAPGIGDSSSGYALWPEYDTNFTNVSKVFIVVFRYNNTVARIGVYEPINSTSPSAAIGLARAVFEKIKS